MRTGMDVATGNKGAIGIHTRGTRIRLPGGFTVPVSITSRQISQEPSERLDVISVCEIG
jgi:hypothetical protein